MTAALPSAAPDVTLTYGSFGLVGGGEPASALALPNACRITMSFGPQELHNKMAAGAARAPRRPKDFTTFRRFSPPFTV
jgi:hypothetical protein